MWRAKILALDMGLSQSDATKTRGVKLVEEEEKFMEVEAAG